MKRAVVPLLLVLLCSSASAALAQTGVKKKRPQPQEYGRVVMGNLSERAGVPAVEFDHWLHRAKFTCRLCHVRLAEGGPAPHQRPGGLPLMSDWGARFKGCVTSVAQVLVSETRLMSVR